jgi:fructose-1,6-bisphosphatase II / sedoheptulose-1,7-bisphosphatase
MNLTSVTKLNTNMKLGTKIESQIDRTMVLEFTRVTEAAARAAISYMGQGDKNAVDGAAVEAMRNALNSLDIKGTVVIGEGEKDEAPMLYIGEDVGTIEGREYGAEFDIAVDPVDGTTLASKGRDGAIAVLAAAEKGNFLNIPDVHYMDKIAVGPEMDINAYNFDMSAGEMVKIAAKQKGVQPSDIVVCMLDRPRNESLMKSVVEAGGRMKLISDGDVAGSIDAAMEETGVDILIGRGGAPEGVITAAALKCLGGDMIGKLYFNDDEMRQKTLDRGIKDLDKVFTMEDLAKGEVLFCATGVTNGAMLDGVHRVAGGETTHSVVMRSRTETIRYIEAFHRS